MTIVFVCSNPKCGAVHAQDPQGHCPMCITDQGGGFSTMRREVRSAIDEAQIKHMVNRFLGWKLPDNFRPDNGISVREGGWSRGFEPTGTNLFDATQAEAMVRYMVEGLG